MDIIEKYMPEIITALIGLFSVGGIGYTAIKMLGRFEDLRKTVKEDERIRALKDSLSGILGNEAALEKRINDILDQMKSIKDIAEKAQSDKQKAEIERIRSEYEENIRRLRSQIAEMRQKLREDRESNER